MTCPRCKTKLREYGTRYTKTEGGDSITLPKYKHWWSCGYHKDIDEPPVMPMTKETLQNSCPKKMLVGSTVIGTIREAIRKHYDEISHLRARRTNWEEVTKYLNELEPKLGAEKQAVANAYNRVKAQSYKGSKKPRVYA